MFMDMRRNAHLLIAITLATCSGCAATKHLVPAAGQEINQVPPSAPRLDFSRTLHSISDWAER